MNSEHKGGQDRLWRSSNGTSAIPNNRKAEIRAARKEMVAFAGKMKRPEKDPSHKVIARNEAEGTSKFAISGPDARWLVEVSSKMPRSLREQDYLDGVCDGRNEAIDAVYADLVQTDESTTWALLTGGNAFVLSSELCTVVFKGKLKRFLVKTDRERGKPIGALRYVHFLIANRGKRFTAKEIMENLGDKNRAAKIKDAKTGMNMSEMIRGKDGTYCPGPQEVICDGKLIRGYNVKDKTTPEEIRKMWKEKQEITARLKRLQGASRQEQYDPQTIELAKRLSWINKWFRDNTFRGRTKKDEDPAKIIRDTVGKYIRRGIGYIKKSLPEAGEHLDKHITPNRGNQWCYSAPESIDWRTT